MSGELVPRGSNVEPGAPTLEGELIDSDPTSVTGAQIDEICRILGFDPSKIMSISIQPDHVVVIRPRRQNGQVTIVDHETVKERIHLRVDRDGDAT
jgi:hypothetical protein